MRPKCLAIEFESSNLTSSTLSLPRSVAGLSQRPNSITRVRDGFRKPCWADEPRIVIDARLLLLKAHLGFMNTWDLRKVFLQQRRAGATVHPLNHEGDVRCRTLGHSECGLLVLRHCAGNRAGIVRESSDD